mmetsp:Transcript_22630/g.28555  ORF Transcript_22630/g.28555 Transcript_22630/m.28555 type:complete len:101 (+) Transcript_22630:374-676(+)
MRLQLQIAHSSTIRRISTILSNGTSTSTLPIQNRSAPSAVTSTERTELYQNQATARRFPIETTRMVPCAPIGARKIKPTTNRLSSSRKRNLKANENGAEE